MGSNVRALVYYNDLYRTRVGNATQTLRDGLETWRDYEAAGAGREGRPET